MTLLFKNIKELVQVREKSIDFLSGTEMKELPCVKDAWLLVEDGKISGFGTMDSCPSIKAEKIIDATGRIVMPTWCDSHTHIIYAGNREGEFVDKINGLSYQEIAERGGGILNSAEKLQNTTEEELYQQSKQRLEEVIRLGTGAIEIKSGYGLTLEAELKMLGVIKRLKENHNLPIKTTFLTAHAVPKIFKNDKASFVNQVIEDWIPKVAQENLAEYIDVFCETGYFSALDTNRILDAAKAYGFIPKIHVNQFNSIGGVKVGVKHHALSVDHLEIMTEEDIQLLKNTKTMPVALPGCSFYLSIPYTPARKMIDAGLPLALASDFNPGSTPSGNMNFVVATACIKMKITPEEAINAATINGAYAMGLENEVGSITIGKAANIIMTKPIHSYVSIAYNFGTNLIEDVYIKGENV